MPVVFLSGVRVTRGIWLALAVFLLSLPASPSVSAASLCGLCDFEAPQGDNPPKLQVKRFVACRAAKLLACDDDDPRGCWVGQLYGTLIDVSRLTASSIPALLVSAEIVAVVAFLFTLTLIVDAGMMMGRGQSFFESPIPARLMRIVIASLVTSLCAASAVRLTDRVWEYVGYAGGAASSIGRGLGVGLRHELSGIEAIADDLRANRISNSQLSDLSHVHQGVINDSVSLVPPLRTQCLALDEQAYTNAGLDGWLGWESVERLNSLYLDQALDLGAVLVGIGWTLLPTSIGSVLDHFSQTARAFTGDFLAIFETLRYVFAIAVLGAGVSLVVTLVFQVMECLLLGALAVACLPLAAWLAVWERSRSAVRQVVAAVMYLVVTLLFVGVTIEIAYVALELVLSLFTSGIVNPDYVQRAGGEGPFNDKFQQACGEIGVYFTEVAASSEAAYGRISVESYGLSQSFSGYLCLLGLDPFEVSGDPSKTVHATLLESTVITWLPQVLILVAGSVLVTMVLKYVSSTASELTSFRGTTNQIAQQVMGSAKGLIGGGAKKIAARM